MSGEETLTDKVVRFLEENPDKVLNAMQIAVQLGEVDHLHSIRTILARLIKRGRVRSPRKGLYQLKEKAS